MRRDVIRLAAALAAALVPVYAPALAQDRAAPSPEADEVRRAEEGFAASFAARDPDRFASFLDESAVFVGNERTLRGRAEVREAWTKMMMDGATPPFSWRPERVVVNGFLGLSSGPVFDRGGRWIGAFTSVWRRQADGSWKIVLDQAAPCTPPASPPPAK